MFEIHHQMLQQIIIFQYLVHKQRFVYKVLAIVVQVLVMMIDVQLNLHVLNKKKKKKKFK